MLDVASTVAPAAKHRLGCRSPGSLPPPPRGEVGTAIGSIMYLIQTRTIAKRRAPQATTLLY
jgi:hypothetical protein